MLKKDQILPIGSLVTVFFKSDGGKETIALIVGHLTMQKHMISRYDYTCVAAPAGIEDGLFYINHSDICSVLHRPSGADYFPENWLERKYAEYTAYYRNYDPAERPDIDTMRGNLKAKFETLKNTKGRFRRFKKIIPIPFVCGALLAVIISDNKIIAAGAFLLAIIFCFLFLVIKQNGD